MAKSIIAFGRFEKNPIGTKETGFRHKRYGLEICSFIDFLLNNENHIEN